MVFFSKKLNSFFILLLTLALVSLAFSAVLAEPSSIGDDDFVISGNEEPEGIDPITVAAKGEEPLPDEGGEISENEIEEGDEEEKEPTEEELAAAEAAEEARIAKLQKRAEELEGELSKIGNNSGAIVNLLTEEKNQEAVYESSALLKKLIESMLNEKRPNYNEISRYGRALCNVERNSSLGNYAQGLGAMNKKKTDLKLAMDFFAKAKNAKKPYKDAASAYTNCLVRRFWLYALLIVIAVLVITASIVMKKKAKKPVVGNEAKNTVKGIDGAELQRLLDEAPVEKKADFPETPVDGSDIANLNVSEGDKAEEKLEEKPIAETHETFADSSDSADVTGEKPFKTETENNIYENSSSVEEKPQIEEVKAFQENNPGFNEKKYEPCNPAKDELEAAISSLGSVVSRTTETTSSGKKIIRVVKKIRVRKDANGNSYVIPDEPQNMLPGLYQARTQAKGEFEGLQSMVRSAEKPAPPIDTQLDILWGNLSRKAMQGHIELMARKNEALSSALAPTTISGTASSGSFYENENRVTDIRYGDVSIDLSEEALKDDLVGKLKMLAITDAELRELFAMKNPAHIPYLIDYITTKPEPVRLAFVAKELGAYGDLAVVDTLSTLLYHEDERVVLAAIQGLEATKLTDAIIPLCPFLRSEIPLYAQASRTALSKFGAVKIMQALKDLPAFTDNKLKEAGIFVLSRMKGSPVEKILKALLNDDSSEVRIQAILAMSYQKNPVYIDSLREFYRIANETEKSMTRKAIVYLNGFNKST